MNLQTGTKQRILVAEDDPISRRLLEVFLMKWGFDVVLATTGLEALELLSRIDAPRLAVLDWMMPGMEGTQVCQKLREFKDRPYIYVLLLTARAGKQDLLEGLRSGVDDYLTKPFDSRELRARLHVGERILALEDRLSAFGEELRFRATHDSLTGISNRGQVMECLRKERARQHRDPKVFSIILADIDHFKYVNDVFGHLAGDAVLRQAALLMSNLLRPYDTVGRYGGEEFLIVVPSSDSAATLALAERIRQEIQDATAMVEGVAITVTASFGVASSTPNSPLDPEDMIRLADGALYLAKARGRNRCEVATSPVRISRSEIPIETLTLRSGTSTERN
jgi:diguanylate cyclase (GGDEF)-like protein